MSSDAQLRPVRAHWAVIAALVAAAGSFAIAMAAFEARGLFDSWDCGASDCDSTGLGATWVAVLFGVAGLALGGPVFSALRATSRREVLFRLVVWLVLVAAAAIIVGQVWKLPQGHPAAD